MQRKKQVQRNTDNTWSAGISLYLLLSKEGLCDFKSADESERSAAYSIRFSAVST